MEIGIHQVAMKKGSYIKMSPKNFGLFQVLRSAGKVAYQLDLHAHSNIYNTFNVNSTKMKDYNKMIYSLSTCFIVQSCISCDKQ